MPRDEYSDLRAAYAKATGVTIRTAQRHQSLGHPDWNRFIGVTAGAAVKRGGVLEKSEVAALAAVSPSRPEARASFYVGDEEGLSPEQVDEKRAWEIHERTFRMWQEMLSDITGEPAVALAYARELPKLRENYEKAKAARVKWEIEQRRLIPSHEFEKFVGQFLVPLGDLMRSLSVELAVLVNPENPAVARAQITGWLRAIAEPQIQGMLTGADEFLVA